MNGPSTNLLISTARHSLVRRMNPRCKSATEGLEVLAVLCILLLIKS